MLYYQGNKIPISLPLKRLNETSTLNLPDLYQRQIIRLGRPWEKNDSSSDNLSIYKYTQVE